MCGTNNNQKCMHYLNKVDNKKKPRLFNFIIFEIFVLCRMEFNKYMEIDSSLVLTDRKQKVDIKSPSTPQIFT
jgi:lysine/ornithine N-monooxygenase